MNNKAAVGFKRLAVCVLVGLSVFMLCAPVMPASTVRAEGCRHDEYEWVFLIKPTCSRATWLHTGQQQLFPKNTIAGNTTINTQKEPAE